MGEFSRHTPSQRLSSSTSVFSWSKAREAEFITQKINSRMMELEKDGTEVMNNLWKLSSWVQDKMEDAKINIEIYKEDLKGSYQKVSKVLVEAEDNIAMLAASIARWQISEVDSEDNHVTNKIDESGKYLDIEPVPRHQVAEEAVKKSVENMSRQIDKKEREGLTIITSQCNMCNICDAKLNKETSFGQKFSPDEISLVHFKTKKQMRNFIEKKPYDPLNDNKVNPLFRNDDSKDQQMRNDKSNDELRAIHADNIKKRNVQEGSQKSRLGTSHPLFRKAVADLTKQKNSNGELSKVVIGEDNNKKSRVKERPQKSGLGIRNHLFRKAVADLTKQKN